jgi:acyl-CoA thioester hydrolase
MTERHPPERLDSTRYPFHHEVRARFGDMDSFQHVNNVSVARYHEDARVEFIRSQFGDWSSGRTGDFHFLVADLHISYLAEVDYPGTYQIGVGIGRIGTSSLTVYAAIFRAGRCLGLCDSVLVHMSPTGPAPLPAQRRALLEAARFESPVTQPAV